MSFHITILGSSSATPTNQRHPTAQVLTYNEHLFLIDCGEGTQMQLNRYKIKAHKINHILISHLHGDHYLGLMGLLSTLHLQGRSHAMHVYGPEALKEIIDIQLLHSQTDLRYELLFHAIPATESTLLFETENISVSTIILNHRIACTGFIFKEINKPFHLIKEKIGIDKVPVEAFNDLKKGLDFTSAEGKSFTVSDYTKPPSDALSYAYCSDTCFDKDVIKSVRNVSLLYHEATFLDEMAERATETFHTTAKQAGTVAREAEVKKLIIGHFSARYRDLNPILEEAKAEFAETHLATEGQQFLID